MIGEYTLKILCDKYNILSGNIINNNILTYGEYLEIDKTLNYLINELKVSGENIEKCPSILYRNVDAIKENINYLKQQNASFSSIESCLHVLSTEPNSLKETYEYIEENYGIEAINKNTFALSCNKNLIIEVEKLGLDKEWNLAIAAGLTFSSTILEETIAIIYGEKYKDYLELLNSIILSQSNIKEVKEILYNEVYNNRPELFTSEILGHAKTEDIRDKLHNKEHNDYKEILYNEVYNNHTGLFTPEILDHAKIEDIRNILHSEGHKSYQKLFTSTTHVK